MPVLTTPFRNSHDLIEPRSKIAKIPELRYYSSLTGGISMSQNSGFRGFPHTKVQDPNSSCGMYPIIEFAVKTRKNHCFVHPTYPLYGPCPGLTMSNYCPKPEDTRKPSKPRIRTFLKVNKMGWDTKSGFGTRNQGLGHGNRAKQG